MRYEEFAKQVVEEFTVKGVIPLENFPDLELYIDQAANLMNKELEIYKKNEKDQVITKTMIGNYVKHNMLPRPVNKKYSKNHLILLTLIYYLKGSFQMDEIEKLMKPLLDNYNSEFDEKINLEGLYGGILELQTAEYKTMGQRVNQDIERIKHYLTDSGLFDDNILELFMFIVSLSIKADAQKFLAQKLLNEYFVQPSRKK